MTTAVTLLLGVLRRNPLIVSVALLIAVVALTFQSIRVSMLSSDLESAKTEVSQVRQERDQLRSIVARNNDAVRALRHEREVLDADFAALRKQIEEMDDDTSCIDAVNRALGNE